MQHDGSSACMPSDKREETVAELLAEWIAVSAEQPAKRDDNVLPFRVPREAAQREASVRTDRKPRGRPKGR